MKKKSSLLVILTMQFLQHKICVQVSGCPQLYFPSLEEDAVCYSENENISLIFWLDTSACQDPSGDYRMEVETRKGDGGIEYDGKLARWNNTCIITSRRATRCTGDYGPAELFKKVNRVHEEFIVRWTWEDFITKQLLSKNRTIKLIVSCQETTVHVLRYTTSSYNPMTTIYLGERGQMH